jgi:hypothetical protein
MLRSTKELMGYHMLATDGQIGKVKDMLFDDRLWMVRYLVVDTGSWLSGRKVIVSLAQIGEPEWERRVIPVGLTMNQVEDSPPLDADAPVSRKYERLWLERFRQPAYPMPIGPMGTPIVADTGVMDAADRKEAKAMAEEKDESTPLRSIDEVSGYDIRATDGEMGHVEEFIADEEWMLRYLVVDTRKWLPGRKFLVSHEWLRSVSWPKQEVVVGLSRRLIEESPKYNPSEPVNREYEERLYDFYGRPHYWQKR